MATGELIVEGGTAFCSSAQVHKNKGAAVPVKVTSQTKKIKKNKYFAQDKPVMTWLDDKAENFNNGQAFVMCQDPKNTQTGYSPCAAKCSIKYKDYYENVEFNSSMKILLDKTTGTCQGYGVPGTIEFAKTGQSKASSTIDVKEADAFQVVNPSSQWTTASGDAKKNSVKSIKITQPLDQKPKGKYFFIQVPETNSLFNPFPLVQKTDTKITLTADYEGDASKITWALFKGEGVKDKVQTFIGLGASAWFNLDNLFKNQDEGVYRIEAYMKKPGDKNCCIIIEVIKDMVQAIECTVKSTLKNIPIPVSVKLKASSIADQAKVLNSGYSLSNRPSPIVKWKIKQKDTILFNSATGAKTDLIDVSITNFILINKPTTLITFKNAGDYTIEAYTNENDDSPITTSVKIADHLGVNSISAKSNVLLRYNDHLKVGVSQYNVSYLPTSKPIQWYLQKDGSRLKIFENSATSKMSSIDKRIDEIVNIDSQAGANYFGKYKIEAYGSAIGADKNPDFKGSDCYSFEVIQNSADSIKIPTTIAKGASVKYEAKARIEPLKGDEKINLQLPEGVTKNEDGTFTFNKEGEFEIKASLSGAYTDGKEITTNVKVAIPEIKRALWAYQTGYKRTESGFKEDCYGFVEIIGLESQTLTAKIWLQGDGSSFYSEPDKYLLEEKKFALDDKGKGSFQINIDDKYKEKLEKALPPTGANPNPAYQIVFTIELPEKGNGSVTLPANLEIKNASPVTGTKFIEVLDDNEVLTITNEKKIKSIVFSTENGKDVQQTVTFYGKTHKLWVHTVNMIDDVLKIDVNKEIPKEGLESGQVIYTHEPKQTYKEEKVGKDGIVEVSFTAKEEWKNPPKNLIIMQPL